MYVHCIMLMKAGETAFSVAKKKGDEKVCEELQQLESKKQPTVKSISTQQFIAVSLYYAKLLD